MSFLRFTMISLFFWGVVYTVSIQPEKEKLAGLEKRSQTLRAEINKIEDNFKYLAAEREDLLQNNRFYIQKLSREKLRLK